jgi:hypothetical protein
MRCEELLGPRLLFRRRQTLNRDEKIQQLLNRPTRLIDHRDRRAVIRPMVAGIKQSREFLLVELGCFCAPKRANTYCSDLPLRLAQQLADGSAA